MTPTEIGRRRQQAVFDFLDQYTVATTKQLASLIWNGDERQARLHLLRLVREKNPRLRRLPHPLFRNGAYVYTTKGMRSGHGQKVLHHLALVDFHLAVVRDLARHGARILPELPWAPGLIPDQTVFWKDTVWAVEHHLSGSFKHTADYRRFMEEEAYSLCHWWRPGISLRLAVVVSGSSTMERVRSELRRQDLSGLLCKVSTRASALEKPSALLK